MSLNFQRKLTRLCRRREITSIKRWFQTVDGLVMPLLLTVEDPDLHYPEIDKLIKFGFENCANNFSHFIKEMKSLKRLLRKDYALMTEDAAALTSVATYRKYFLRFRPSEEDPYQQVKYLLCWTQTRASGMADRRMVRQSLDKCEATLSEVRRPPRPSTEGSRDYSYRLEPEGVPVLPSDHLNLMASRIAFRVRGETAHVSAGPNSCLESTRRKGGQTGYIKVLARRRCLRTVYDHRTLEPSQIPARPIRSAKDLVDWSVQQTLEHPTYVRCVRLHAVPEPSKARTITVCSLPYLVIVGVISKLLQPAVASDITRSGLKASRNLWKFLYEDLDPHSGLWGDIRPNPYRPGQHTLYALSSDLSEATDYGDLAVARQLLCAILAKCSQIPGFPLGLAQLAKTLFIGKRFCLRNDSGRCRYFVKRNGWLMGDRLTKVILTLAHELVLISCGLYASRICGDDVVALSTSKEALEKYFEEVRRLGFKVSEEDSYISSRLLFYCEEGSLVPQKYNDLPAVCCRRKTTSCYVDYPRIRLLIPTRDETRAYSSTDVGRFALLGKEMRWVIQTNGPRSLFWRATLLQHLNVPQSPDTLCPFLPIEIGGDGACTPDPSSLEGMVEVKSRDLPETHFRMRQLLTSKWGYRYVRSPVLNDVVHKYHLLVPRIAELKELLRSLQPDAILESDGFLLQSIKVDGIEDPERTFFRLWRSYYWNSILTTGKEPQDVLIPVDRHHSHGSDHIPLSSEEYAQFWIAQVQGGFTFHNQYDYKVISNRVICHDYLNLGWTCGFPTIHGPSRTEGLVEIFRPFMLNEENSNNFLEYLATNAAMDPKVRETLHKYVESDSFLLLEASRRWRSRRETPEAILLVSEDKKLLERLARVQSSHFKWNEPPLDGIETPFFAGLVHPADWQVGMLQFYENWCRWTLGAHTVEVLPDFGAIAYANSNTDGFGVIYDDPYVHCSPLRSRQHSRYMGTYTLSIDERSSRLRGSEPEVVSLTTRGRRELEGHQRPMSRSPSPRWRGENMFGISDTAYRDLRISESFPREGRPPLL